MYQIYDISDVSYICNKMNAYKQQVDKNRIYVYMPVLCK